MAKYIAHSRISENNTIYGEAGDQTGLEVCIQEFYVKPWGHVIRIDNEKVRNQFANNMIDIARNNAVGYCQAGRNSLLTEAIKVKFDFSKITVKCECDCSSATAICLLGAIYIVLGESAYKKAYEILVTSGNCSTTRTLRNQMTTLKTKGILPVTVYTSASYVGGTSNAVFGDIYLKEGSHVVVYVDDGNKKINNTTNNNVSTTTPSTPTTPTTTSNRTIGIAVAKTTMKVRSESSTTNSSTLGYVNKGTSVEVIEVLSNGWYKIKWNKSTSGYAYTSNAGGNYYTYTAKPSTNPSNSTTTNTTQTKPQTMYRVQLGSFSVKSNADRLLAGVKSKGYSDAFIAFKNNTYKVQVGAFSVKSNADRRLAEMKKLGYTDAFITT